MNNSQFEMTTLPGGLRVLTERHPDVASATVGVWINAGSVYEEKEELGLAHLLEHIVFKGAQTVKGSLRSATQIAAQMDILGGQMNAFTEREFVCYHVKVLADHLPPALELLCDLIARPTLDAEALELEKGVILEEIKSVEDTPEELVEDLFTETIWHRSRWGRSILGTPRSVSNLTVQDLRRYLRTHYTPDNLVVTAVGDVQHGRVVKLAEKFLHDLPRHATSNSRRTPASPHVSSHRVQMVRDTEQVHLCCGTRAYAYDDARRFPAWLLDQIMTGGYSSRLFQEIREKRGLCYNIGPLSASYRKAGFWAVETSFAPEQARRVVDIIGRELRKVKSKGVSRTELKRAQEMSRINILLSEESSSAQMGRIARNELCYGRQRSVQEVLNDVLSVSADDVQRVAHEMFSPDTMNLAAVGPFDEAECPLLVDVG
ncbi:MAG TPA: pitrilysin family protein [Abditibacteriaceae bacterium]|jgi:predicted Zn-dependent peptidase